MRVLRDTPSINTEIKENPDPTIANQLTRHLAFGAEYEDARDLLTVFVIERGDTLTTIDDAMEGGFMVNRYSGRQVDDRGFAPCFETLEEHPTFYEMLFIQSDEGHALLILVPRVPGIDPDLLAMCAKHATPAPQLSS